MRVHLLPAGALPLVMAAGPGAAFAVDYLTPAQAQQAIFPQADHFALRTVQLDAGQLKALTERSGLPARSAQWKLLQASQAGKVLGWVVVDNVVGKFELITYAVGIALDGSVKQVEILSYRESHGGEVRLPAWRKQFGGKTLAAPIKLGEDIANISGATLSCTHVTEGVRRIVAVVEQAVAAKLLGA